MSRFIIKLSYLEKSKRLRASPTTLFGKTSLARFAKSGMQISGPKRVHLQQFGIIHLPNLDLIYIRNPRRQK
jgi:hypothetical protein